jgi:hypothetical protein
MDLGPEVLAAFERLYTDVVGHATGAKIPYDILAPKWQFLCYLTDNKGVLMHGSPKPDIEEFEPRQSDDVGEFGNRRAVYAACLEPVRPLARLNITPADFPLLAQIRGHNHATLRERIMHNPEGVPWVDE